MAVTFDDASDYLDLEDTEDVNSLAVLEVVVDAANAWVAAKVAAVSINNPAVKLGTFELIRHLWESQRGPISAPLSGDTIVAQSGPAFAIPNRVLELLGPWLIARGTPKSSFPPAIPLPDPPYITWRPGQRVPQW